jgi:outer membrane protein assembly factor BamE
MRILVLLLSLLLASCSMQLYKIDVQQGNAITPEMVSKLKLGMTRSQVRFILGTPLIADPFHTNRWDYIYSYRKSDTVTERRTLSVIFEQDLVKRVEGDALPPGGITETVQKAPKIVEAIQVAEPVRTVELVSVPVPVPEKIAETPPPAEQPGVDEGVSLLMAPEIGKASHIGKRSHKNSKKKHRKKKPRLTQ